MGKFLIKQDSVVLREFGYKRSDFETVRSLLYSFTGIRLADSKDSMVYSRLVRRIRSLGLNSFKSYLDYLQRNADEKEQFINALTTNLTSFFREAHHFEILAHYLKNHLHTKTIWCAASSTGEEAYSIAMVVAETYGKFDAPIKIIATDIDSQVLQHAKEGVYTEDRIQDLGIQRCKDFFYRGKGSKKGFVKVVPELKKMVEFRQLNLLDSTWNIPSPLDVIFCRNVMIYFDKPTQLLILERMIKRLTNDGLYVAGHSENFTHAKHLVKPVGHTTYMRNISGNH